LNQEIRFIYHTNDLEVEVSIVDTSLSEVLDAFQRFLLASGYADYGTLVFEKETPNATQDA
jgi:hypothetical protein